MKNYWLENKVDEFGLPKIDFVWIRQRWNVEVTERERHLWPGKWIISGWYEDEKEDYKKAEKEWEKRCNEAWAKRHKDKPVLSGLEQMQQLADGISLFGYEDYFNWNVTTPSWSLHKDGTWNKALIKSFDDWHGKSMKDYPGVYNSYEEALATLGRSPNMPLKFEGYTEYLNEFMRTYDYNR